MLVLVTALSTACRSLIGTLHIRAILPAGMGMCGNVCSCCHLAAETVEQQVWRCSSDSCHIWHLCPVHGASHICSVPAGMHMEGDPTSKAAASGYSQGLG